MQLPVETRIKIAKQFDIVKTGPTHVENNTVKSDGYAIKDIDTKLSPVAIQTFLGQESAGSSSEQLWKCLIDKIEGRMPLEVEERKILDQASIMKTFNSNISQAPTALAVEEPKKESTTFLPKKPRDRVTKLKTNVKTTK